MIEEEIDYSLLVEYNMSKKDTTAWIHTFLTDYVPNFEQAKAFFVKKNMKITKKEYDRICKKRYCKTI